ncbi:MAG: hypothetical protein COB38_11140 [Gammaproteobacteria bacterium]|nr:MAG: hypothetical protein COB38_11140 [Gammaproteobacteria bacterium]
MIDALIITLRETLEASLIISFLLIFSKVQGISFRWLIYALITGLIIAFVFAQQMPEISELGDGIGQEVLQSGILFCIAMTLLIIQFFIAIRENNNLSVNNQPISNQQGDNAFSYYYGLAISTAISLEGAEIMIYIHSQLQISENTAPSITGGFLGLGIGISMAVIFYYLLTQIIPKYGVLLSRIFIILISAAMLSQSLTFLMQAGLIESDLPFWNTDWIVSETSFIGQILYSLIGYESTPTFSQVVLYISTIVLAFITPFIHAKYHSRLSPDA